MKPWHCGCSTTIAWRRAEAQREKFQSLSIEHQGAAIGPITLSIGFAPRPSHGPGGFDVV
jgi:hypothetical protein